MNSPKCGGIEGWDLHESKGEAQCDFCVKAKKSFDQAIENAYTDENTFVLGRGAKLLYGSEMVRFLCEVVSEQQPIDRLSLVSRLDAVHDPAKVFELTRHLLGLKRLNRPTKARRQQVDDLKKTATVKHLRCGKTLGSINLFEGKKVLVANIPLRDKVDAKTLAEAEGYSPSGFSDKSETEPAKGKQDTRHLVPVEVAPDADVLFTNCPLCRRPLTATVGMYMANPDKDSNLFVS
jgi:hypothetical protein